MRLRLSFLFHHVLGLLSLQVAVATFATESVPLTPSSPASSEPSIQQDLNPSANLTPPEQKIQPLEPIGHIDSSPVPTPPLAATPQAPNKPLVTPRSRVALFAQLGPGVFTGQSSTTLIWTTDPVLFFNAGLSIYLFDQCQSKKTGSCVELLLNIKFVTETIFQPSANNLTTLGGLVGIEPRIYFGAQRRIAWTLQGSLGYGYMVDSNFADYKGGVWGIVGTGIFVAFPSTGLGLSLQVNYSPDANNYHSFYFPVGLQYRF